MVLVSYQPYICIELCKLIIYIFGLAVVRRLFHAGQRDILPLRGEPHDYVGFHHRSVLPRRCADARHAQAPREAHLWPSEVVTLGLLHALKGVGNRAFYRWLTRDYRMLFPRLPERTWLFRLFTTHQDWTQVFLASPTVLGVIDTYGIELIHPIREGRSPQQIGRKGLSNHRWIVGGKLCLLVDQYGLVVGWDCATANVAYNTFQWLIRQVDGRMIVLSDTAFHAAEGDPANLKLCPRGE
jgi:hypothetical protein